MAIKVAIGHTLRLALLQAALLLKENGTSTLIQL